SSIQEQRSGLELQIPPSRFESLLEGSTPYDDGKISSQFCLCRVIGGRNSLPGQPSLPANEEQSGKNRQGSNAFWPHEEFAPSSWRMFGCLCFLAGMACLGLGDARSWRTVTCAILFVLIAWVCIAGHTENDDQDSGEKDNRPISQHVAS